MTSALRVRVPVTVQSAAAPVLRVTVLGVILRGCQSLIALVNVELLAHALGPSGRGQYFLFVSAVILLARLADLGMSPSAVVFVGRVPGAARALHRRLGVGVIGLWLIALGIGSVALGLVNQGIGDLPRDRIWLAVLVLPLAMYEQVWVHLMVGMRRVVLMNSVQTCAAAVTMVCNVVFVVLASDGVPAAIAIYCGVLLVKTPFLLALAIRSCRNSAPEEAAPGLREMAAFSLRGYPNGVASLMWSRLPTFVLDLTQGSAAVGLFSVAQQVLEQLLLPVQATQDAIYQNVTRLPRRLATLTMNRYLRTSLSAMLPVLVVCALLAPWAMPLVFGAPFEGSAAVFQILLISLLASMVPALLSPYFVGQLQRPDLASGVAWLRVLLALGLSAWLAPLLAERGVAIALVGADASATLLILLLYVRIAATRLAYVVVPRRTDFAAILGHAADR